MHAVEVSELFIYPIKSAAGIPVESAPVSDRGFEHDRRFMVTDASGTFITQREHPVMASVVARIHEDELLIEKKGVGHLALPLRPQAGGHRRVRVWGDQCDALSLGPGASRFFQLVLGIESELVYMPDESIRPVDPDYATIGDHVSFADGFPFLLVSQASLDDLNDRLAAAGKEKVTMQRFRPNIVVTGTGAYDEDTWDEFAIGTVNFRVAKPCARCVMVNVDPATGERGREPLLTLSAYRKQGSKVMFGQNLVHNGHGLVRRGDRLRPLD